MLRRTCLINFFRFVCQNDEESLGLSIIMLQFGSRDSCIFRNSIITPYSSHELSLSDLSPANSPGNDSQARSELVEHLLYYV
jgi:hypothetical protein